MLLLVFGARFLLSSGMMILTWPAIALVMAYEPSHWFRWSTTLLVGVAAGLWAIDQFERHRDLKVRYWAEYERARRYFGREDETSS